MTEEYLRRHALQSIASQLEEGLSQKQIDQDYRQYINACIASQWNYDRFIGQEDYNYKLFKELRQLKLKDSELLEHIKNLQNIKRPTDD